jgi:glyoxylase-like metal-dependent hydrolase (beta-lactamase superfamily II)
MRQLFFLLCVLLPALAVAQGAKREISHIAGSVYRFQNNFHYSVFAVTEAGILVTDPIDRDAASWLSAELAKRFGKPVRYLVYSHDHADHIAGGEVFAEAGAIVIAHDNAKRWIAEERRPTAAPQITFSDRMSIELGGTTVELIYTGRNHSDNSIVLRFPAERLLFAVDFIPVETLAFRDFPVAYVEEWIESLRRVEQLEFDQLVPGHGPIGRKEHVAMFREYLQDLRGGVMSLVRAGKSLDEIKRELRLPRYESWARYKDFWELNVEGMYRDVIQHRRGN